MRAYAVSDDIASKDAHVAVVAEGHDGRRFLCDLGDMWWQPMCVEAAQRTPVRGFFPAADVATTRETGVSGAEIVRVDYHRAGGKVSAQCYDLSPLSEGVLRDAAAHNQAYLSQRLVEVRDFARRAHWETDGDEAHWSTAAGLVHDGAFASSADAARAIAGHTGMNADYVAACLDAFDALRG